MIEFFGKRIRDLFSEYRTRIVIASCQGGRLVAYSLGNLRSEINSLPTCPGKTAPNIGGTPDSCPVFAYHVACSPKTSQRGIHDRCTNGELECPECKRTLYDNFLELTKLTNDADEPDCYGL